MTEWLVMKAAVMPAVMASCSERIPAYRARLSWLDAVKGWKEHVQAVAAALICHIMLWRPSVCMHRETAARSFSD